MNIPITIDNVRSLFNFMKVTETESFYDSYGKAEACYKALFADCTTRAYGKKGLAINELVVYHKFHTWAWLMPVVDKIVRTQRVYDKGTDLCHARTFGMQNDDNQFMVRFNGCPLHTSDTLFNATLLAVLDFVSTVEAHPEDFILP